MIVAPISQRKEVGNLRWLQKKTNFIFSFTTYKRIRKILVRKSEACMKLPFLRSVSENDGKQWSSGKPGIFNIVAKKKKVSFMHS